MSTRRSEIVVKGAKTNNLKNISLSIPHNKFIVVTGISGSGKSSLVFDIIAKEGQRRYFETLPSFARQYMGKLNRPDVDKIEGLSPVIAIGQRTSGMHSRSTVGTMSEIYDLLRLLYARTGRSSEGIKLSRALFSFNSNIGKCNHCNGIGKEEKIDLNKLIAFPKKTIREGALAPTLPNGYIMYSQVTIDVLNQVCNAEGFDVDIAWNDLTEEQRNVILYGSEKIKVPFGKHSLESRLKWTGIKAKPREEGHYKGMIPIMSDILRRDRNANILKYVHALTCSVCQGSRLNQSALRVKVKDKSIAEIITYDLNKLNTWISSNEWDEIGQTIVFQINKQIKLMQDLGLGHMTLDRSAKTLRPSEIQRIRIANQILVPLSDVLYVFDEPSIGLHKSENKNLIYYLKQLVRKGNTVIVVEHDLDTIRNAEHIIEIGPKAGEEGGQLIYNGSFDNFIKSKELEKNSLTYTAFISKINALKNPTSKTNNKSILLNRCHARNLKNINVEFQLGKLNVVSGKSGSGKSSLVKETLKKIIQQNLGEDQNGIPCITNHKNIEYINKLIFIDHSPIGKTPRSNPATYLGISNYIRDLFAAQAESKKLGFTKSRFSFNNKGGRCENCQGAGKTQIGMHFLGNVDLICGTCNADRFNKKTLGVKYNGLSIADIYKLSINEAVSFFSEQKKILHGLTILKEIGLGYLTLGQSSTTLSGGEAQRIKIANHLQKKDTGATMYIIIEPSNGLHYVDIKTLLQLFNKINEKGNTIVCIEQDENIIAWSDWHIELGSVKGSSGGEVIHQGVPKRNLHSSNTKSIRNSPVPISKEIKLKGVTTHGLKNINVSIPKNQLTVVTGLSGSGKSSLVYDTLFSEANARFTESLSTFHKSFLRQNSQAKIKSYSGLGPAIGINRKGGSPSKRSTVGTLSGVYDNFRLLYSRIAQHQGKVYTAQHFSFNHHLGACTNCAGLGIKRECDPEKIIVSHNKSILNGAISTNKTIAYYADLNGQFMATLKEVVKEEKWNLETPWQELESEVRNKILFGTGEKVWKTTWNFTTKSRSGTQEISAKWLGFCEYINDEYRRKLHNKNIVNLESLLHDITCPTCLGSRLKSELMEAKFQGKSIHELSQMNINSCLTLLESVDNKKNIDPTILAICKIALPSVKETLRTIVNLGLGYLNLDRSIKSLSGGERQRITLAGQLSTHLFGVTYVLDEPTIGLDYRQVTVLTEVLRKIVDSGNTVVVVEHDPTFIKNADYLIEMGPGAGINGGEISYAGKVQDIGQTKNSVTYQMLQKKEYFPIKKANKKGEPFGIKGACANNLKSINLEFNSNQIIAITGASGSGKSSLIKNVLYKSWTQGKPIDCTSTFGMDIFEKVILIDQEIVLQNRLSTPLTFTGIIENVKAIFANTETAKEKGFKKADFSYQSKNGKCKMCAGSGQLKTSMDFMSDIWLTCDSCKGIRYNNEILECDVRGKTIGDILRLSVEKAIQFFEDKTILEKLNVLKSVGVGHLILGQSGNTLSGGESQRLKLATSIMQKHKGAVLYLYDEPSTGLHYFDILKLIDVFKFLVERGDSIIFIEHNSTLIQSADQVIRLGPGSGEEGGKLVHNFEE